MLYTFGRKDERLLFQYPENEQNLDKIHIVIRTDNLSFFFSNIDITFARSPHTYKKWQLTAYNAIMDGYNALKARYDKQVYMASMGSAKIQGRNPGVNRIIEKQEIKRNCISLIRNKKLDFNYIIQNAKDYPEINKAELDASRGELLYLE